MGQVMITTCQAAQCRRILENADSPIVAARLAEMLDLSGSRETQRRRVRAIIRDLRETDGAWIVATLQGGYWLTDDPAMWRDYNEGRKIDAKRIIGKAHKQKMAVDSTGQGVLFGLQTACGIG